MNLANVSAGRHPPENINVIIEIPMRGEPVKYEVDKETGAMFVDRFLDVAMVYPCNYGYIPHTLAGDGDPCDVLVPTPVPLISGAVIRCRPIGVLQMEDDAGQDSKILAMPQISTYRAYADIETPAGLKPALLARIEHFFQHYKDLEPGKWVKLIGWADRATAYAEIRDALARFEAQPVRPAF
jgi:inorganic pyrophosphatase